MTRDTDQEVANDSENRHGQIATSLKSSDHDGSFLTKFLKQVVFLLLGFCLSFLYFKLYLWIVLANNLHLCEFLAFISIALQIFILFIVMLCMQHPARN